MIDIINQIKGIKIIYIIVLLILFYVGSKVLYWIIEKVIKAFVRKTKTQLDDLILEKTDKPVVWLFFFIALRVFILPLINFKILGEINDSIIILLISLVIIAAVDVLIDFWGKKWAKKTKSRLDDDLLPLFHKFSKITIFIIAFIMILDVWSINITPFLASLGVAGIILAFALQSTLGNIFGGISLILDKNVSRGDTIKLTSGEFGKVIDVGIRSTKVKTFDNEIYIIPNGRLADTTIQNYAQPDLSARIVIDFGVVYGSESEKVRKVVVDVMKKHKVVLKDPQPDVIFINMADFSLQFQARCWVDSYKKRFDTRVQLVEQIYNALNKNKIGIPFPTHTVYLKK